MARIALAPQGAKVLAGQQKPLSKNALTPQQTATLEHLGQAKLLEMYRRMVLIRSFEQRCEQCYQQRKIGGFLHTYMLMAELFGKVTGLCHGKAGSMHFYSKEKNLLGGHGIVGGQVPVGLGAAYRASYMGTDQVSLIFLGDGAVNQGSFHETLNMASLWHLPAIFIIENNQYGMGTSVKRSTAVTDMTLKAQGYNMEGQIVDGMNLLDCFEVVNQGVKKRRKEPRPLLIEAKTYRYRGHSISDPGTYRSKEEIEIYQRIDPISQVRGLLRELNWLDEVGAKAMEKEVRKEVADAVTFADESPEPGPEERERDVFAP